MRAGSFEGLRSTDFEAYLPEKWASNVYTRERLEAKQCLVNLARSLEPAFGEQGLEVQRYASDEHPSLWNHKKVDAQWVFFWRTEGDRKKLEAEVDLERTLAATLADPTPMTRHAFLALRLDHGSLRVGFHLHGNAWVDQHNLRNKLAQPELREQLIELVRELPQPITVGLSGGEPRPAGEVAPGELVEMVEALAEQDETFLLVSLELDRATVLEMGGELSGYLLPRMKGFAAVYRFVAWSPENNFVSSDAEFQKQRAVRGERRGELEAAAARRREVMEEKRKHEAEARKELEELFRREAASRAAAPPRRPRPPRTGDEGPGRDKRFQPPRKDRDRPRPPSERTVPKRRGKEKPPPKRPGPIPTPETPIPIETGHQVRVSKGPLAGQVGLVQEVDAKGTARVMVGLLATRIPLEDLIGLGAPTSDRRSLPSNKK